MKERLLIRDFGRIFTMKMPMKNSFTVQENGVKVVTADVSSILTRTKRIHVGENTPAFAYFVCGFQDSIDTYTHHGMTPHVWLYKTEAEVKAYCENKVVSYKEFYADSEEEIDTLIANNQKCLENHRRSLLAG